MADEHYAEWDTRRTSYDAPGLSEMDIDNLNTWRAWVQTTLARLQAEGHDVRVHRAYSDGYDGALLQIWQDGVKRELHWRPAP